MGGIENFLSWLLKDKIPWYHGTLLYSDFYIIIYQYFTKFTKFVHFNVQLMSDEKYLLIKSLIC